MKWAQLRVGVYWHIFPTASEAKDAVWRDPNMLFNILPRDLVDRVNQVEMVVYFKNGSVLQLKGADDPDYLRGAGPVGIVLDEFAKMKYEAWQVLEPILRANNGWCWFIGTPKGKNHLHRMYVRGQEGHDEWKSWLLKASTSGIIPKDQLDEAYRTAHDKSFYNQEYECEFLEGEGSVFRNVRAVMTASPHPPDQRHLYVLGVDLAKHRDYTVVVVYDRTTNQQVYQDRFNKLEWPYVKKKIKAVSDHYNKALVVLDATGIGDPIFDDLAREQVPVLPYKITQPSKKDLIEKLSIWIDQGNFKMLPIQDTLLEFENFSYIMGQTGQIRYGAPEGFHDDIVIAHALAVSNLQPLLTVPLPPKKTRIQLHHERAKKRQYDTDFEQEDWAEWEHYS